MSRKLKSSIRMAMRSCLARCRVSPTPLAALAEFAEKLAAMGWDDESIHEVEKGVLFGLMGREAEQRQESESA